jgi:oxygen-independent coproporphyrinogen-3 oxidase
MTAELDAETLVRLDAAVPRYTSYPTVPAWRAIAVREQTLHRNFMGYTTREDLPIVGLGVSAISEIGGLYAQQESRLGAWYRAIGAGGDGVVRGCVLTAEDRARRAVIQGLMCRLRIDAHALAAFPEALPGLVAFAGQGLGAFTPDGGFALAGIGRFAVRQVAALFDAGLSAVDSSRFSRAV